MIGKGNGTPHVWTSKMEHYLRVLHAKHDASFTTIAAEMTHTFGFEITRSACIGKANRLDLPRRFQPHATRKAITAKVRKMKPVKTDVPIPPPQIVRDPTPFTLLITDLEVGDCKWPSGAAWEHPPFFYCGAPSLVGRPYCLAHTQRSVSNWVKS